MIDTLWVDVRYHFVRPGKNVTEFFKKIHVNLNLFGGAIHSDEDILHDVGISGDSDRYCPINPLATHEVYAEGNMTTITETILINISRTQHRPTKCRSWATFVVLQARFETQKKHLARLYLCFSISSGLTEKSNHYGVFFKPFSDSLKMKRLSSDIVYSHSLNWSRRTFLKWVSF